MTDTAQIDTGPAFCISLASRPERREFCLRQFRSEGIDVEFFDAIVPDDAGGFTSRGSRGCSMSHVEVLTRAQQLSAPIVTVFEDDVLLPRGFEDIRRRVLAQLDGLDWHTIFWGYLDDTPTRPVEGRPLLREIDPAHPVIGAHAYTIRTATLPPMVRYLHESLEVRPAFYDGMMHMYRQHAGLIAHAHTLRQATQASFISNLTPQGENLFRNTARWIKRRVQALRR